MSEIASPPDARLDPGPAAAPGLPPVGRGGSGRIWGPIVAVVVLLLIWQAVSLILGSGARLASPARVWASLAHLTGDGTAAWAVAISVGRGVVGFAVAAVAGTALGVAVGLNRLLRTGVGPLLLAVQTLPSAAWVPFAVLWLRHSDAAMYAVIVAAAAPAIAAGVVTGLDQVPAALRTAGRSLGARGWTLARFVLLPAALPGYVAALKAGWAFSWRALMTGELIIGVVGAHPGLGQLLSEGKSRADLPDLIAVVLLILLIGLVVELAGFGPLERRVMTRHGLAAAVAGPGPAGGKP